VKPPDLDLLTELAILVRDLTQFVSTALTAEQQGHDYPHWPGDEARLGECLVALGHRLRARLTDATAEARPETLELVTALRAVNAHVEPVAAALFAGTIPVEKQHEFASLLSSVSELLHQHADEVSPPTEVARRQAIGEHNLLRGSGTPLPR
jgi:hypothetical protein